MKKLKFFLQMIILCMCVILYFILDSKTVTTEIIKKDFEYSIITIDSCQYIKYDSTAIDFRLIHKGDCKYCIKRINSLK